MGETDRENGPKVWPWWKALLTALGAAALGAVLGPLWVAEHDLSTKDAWMAVGLGSLAGGAGAAILMARQWKRVDPRVPTAPSRTTGMVTSIGVVSGGIAISLTRAPLLALGTLSLCLGFFVVLFTLAAVWLRLRMPLAHPKKRHAGDRHLDGK